MVEEFAPGRANKLWVLEQVPGRWRRLRYHTAGRIDGLLERYEIVGLSEEIGPGDDDDDASLGAEGPESERALEASAAERWAESRRDAESIPSYAGSLPEKKRLGIWERYARRDDRMVFRSALLLKSTRSSAGLRKLAVATGDRVVFKMKMRFARDHTSDSVDDIALVTFQLYPAAEASIAIQCHNAQSSILDTHRTFDTSLFANPVVADAVLSKAGGRKGRKGARKDGSEDEAAVFVEPELTALRAMETECYEALRESKRATDEVLFQRGVEENCSAGRPGSPRGDALGLGEAGGSDALPADAASAPPMFRETVFDIAKRKMLESAIDGELGAEFANGKDDADSVSKLGQKVDYLTSFMPRLGGALEAQPLSHAEAKDVRDKCIHASRERIQERINIIQRRLKLQEEDLEKRQAQYKRSRDHVDGADEEYEQFCLKVMFSIQILEHRLRQHEKQVPEKYNSLIKKLTADPRLEAYYGARS